LITNSLIDGSLQRDQTQTTYRLALASFICRRTRPLSPVS
jgi:hypothetical protein